MSATPEDRTDEVEAEGGNGSGGTLFKRITSGEPQDRGVRRLAYAVGGGFVALGLAGLGLVWRRRRG